MEKLKAELRKAINRLAEYKKLDDERGLTEDEVRQSDELMSEIKDMEANIKRNEERDAILAKREMPTSDPVEERAHEAAKEHRFNHIGEFFQAVARASAPGGRVDERLIPIQGETRAATGLSEGVPADGGYLVQSDFATDLASDAQQAAMLLGKTNPHTCSGPSNTLTVNGLDETSRVNGSRFGGVQTYWAHEAATVTATKPKFRQMTMTLNKLMGICYVTDEMLQDTAYLGSYVQGAFSEELGFKADDGIIRGTGAGEMLGILNAGCTVSVGKETGQAADTIVAENIEKMYPRIFARSLGKAEWYINQDCWPQLFQLSHTVGAGGVPMFVPAGGLSSAPFGTLLGRPITPIEQCATLGDTGDIILADLSRYRTINKGGIQQAISMHVQFLYAEQVFRVIWRLDGQPDRQTALTPYKGSATQSAFVKLDAR